MKHIDGFLSIEAGGNSYSAESCEYIAELIEEKSSQRMFRADLSNLFVSRKKEEIPRAIEVLLEACATRPLKVLNLSSNAVGLNVESIGTFLA